MSLVQCQFDCGEPLLLDVDEKILLHGTSRENAHSIVRHGFDHRTSATGMYGDGVYFASAACKSHQYACSTRCGITSCQCRCERTLIISRVALGDAYHTHRTLFHERRPPKRNGTAGAHGSVMVQPGVISGHVHQRQIHQEFVIFDREQAYPAFVVKYVV